MHVIPAIDLKAGECVRLLQGRKNDVTVYSSNPSETAQKWESFGAELLHIVDLDAAFSGERENMSAIRMIRGAVKIPIQVGGGIRTKETLEEIFLAGVDRAVIGTAAVEDPGFLKAACDGYPGRIVAGIDARNGMVAIKGWEEVTTVSAFELARRLESVGIAGIIYTDIERDGMLTGPNIEATRTISGSVHIPVIASGGIAGMEDIRNLLTIPNLWGAITGKAIYSDALDLREAIRVAKDHGCSQRE
jgi:phosphoribosylformimino-5-aminoimidazole carboxamide ribotide isomerase